MKKALLTCKGMLPDSVVEIIAKQLDLRTAPCAMNEKDFIKKLQGVNFHLMGGEEFYSAEVANAATDLKDIYFIGMMPDTYRSTEAFEILSQRGIKIIPTGGGQAAVVRSTLDIFYDEFLMTPLFSRNFKWVAGEPGGMKRLLRNLDLVVIGAGNIGREILNGSYLDFGRSFYGGGRSKKEELEKLGIHWVPDLKKAFMLGNIFSINLSYSAETHHLIKYEHLKMMRENSLLINSARAALIEPVGLLKFLRRRPDVLAILDVFYVEGKDYEKLGFRNLKDMQNIYAEIIAQGNVLFLQHRFASRHPELAVPEYGENLLRILREQKIIT